MLEGPELVTMGPESLRNSDHQGSTGVKIPVTGVSPGSNPGHRDPIGVKIPVTGIPPGSNPGHRGLTGVSPGSHRGQTPVTGVSPGSHRGQTPVTGVSPGSKSRPPGSHRDQHPGHRDHGHPGGRGFFTGTRWQNKHWEIILRASTYSNLSAFAANEGVGESNIHCW